MRMSLMLCLVVGTLQSFVQLIQQEVTSDKDFLPSNLNDVFHFIIQFALHVTAQVQPKSPKEFWKDVCQNVVWI